ncbi:hypothetical protein [Mycolicibacterium austroafricanum]|uniref:hypothetical protein n=1 Tax=Mycolicibacterium austroafricanum TaxID=39687 RepID=UPI001CA361BB|nr:hypothetical protein [Mycolicibacterium austroafricanum]QZT62293.1 hypothetical protein JN085_25960 [Mycolicibacterium austroafricanum]
MTKRRMLIAVLAVLGAVLGAGIGALAAAAPSRYSASANVAFLPSPNLTTVESSNFWEVLTRGQVTRTAAIVYDDPRWLTQAADAAEVPRDDLTLEAVALPETTMLTVTVSARSAGAAEAALNNVLTTATPEVTSLVAPYFVKVLWPPESSAKAVPAPGWLQLAVGGALGGFLIGAGIGWLVQRRRGDAGSAGKHSDGSTHGAPPGS